MKLFGRMRKYGRSLFVWEFSKLMTARSVLVVLLLAAVSAYTSYGYYTEKESDSEAAYEKFIANEWYGPLTIEREAEFYARREEIDGYISDTAYSDMTEAYASGEITAEEYEDFTTGYRRAIRESPMMDRLEEAVARISKVRNESGVVGWLIPTGGVSRLLGRDVNVWRLAAVVIVCVRLYTPDHAGRVSESDFALISKTTKRGRRSLFRAKLSAAATVAVMISLIFEAADLLIGLTVTDGLPELFAAPVLSLWNYAMFRDGITVGGFIAAAAVIRFAATLMLALLTGALSFVLKRMMPTLLAVAMFTLVPYALVYMGMLTFRLLDFTAALSGCRLLRLSAVSVFFTGIYTFAAVDLVGFAVLTLAALLFVRSRMGR